MVAKLVRREHSYTFIGTLDLIPLRTQKQPDTAYSIGCREHGGIAPNMIVLQVNKPRRAKNKNTPSESPENEALLPELGGDSWEEKNEKEDRDPNMI